jgi:pimeloyl-ACP methyl ester carboxylesterase
MIKTKSFELATFEKGSPDCQKLALVLPGKLDTKDYAHMRSHVDLLAGLGFYAVSFDPPGTWESKGAISLYNTTNYLKSVDELIERFGNKPTFIMGHSRGASVSLMAAARNPKIIGYAAVMPAISRESLTRNFSKVSMRDLPPGGGEKIKKFELPDSFHEDEMNYRLTDEFLKCEKPKLFIFGKTDQIINYDGAVEMYKEFLDPKEAHTLECGHDYRHYPDKIEEVNEAIKNFLAKFDI